MHSARWRVEVAGKCADMAGLTLRWLLTGAASAGLRLESRGNEICIHFSVMAPDFDTAVSRALQKWRDTQSSCALPAIDLDHFAVDRAGPPRPEAGSTRRRRPAPHPRSASACLDLPFGTERDDIGGRGAERAPARLLPLRR